MEPPSKVDGTGSGESIRDAKVQALSAIPPITLDDCFLGQQPWLHRRKPFGILPGHL